MNFPNGFIEWHETHFEVVSFMRIIIDYSEDHSLIEKRFKEQGTGGLYELAAELTNEFEEKYKGTEWGKELDWHDTLEEFLNSKR